MENWPDPGHWLVNTISKWKFCNFSNVVQNGKWGMLIDKVDNKIIRSISVSVRLTVILYYIIIYLCFTFMWRPCHRSTANWFSSSLWKFDPSNIYRFDYQVSRNSTRKHKKKYKGLTSLTSNINRARAGDWISFIIQKQNQYFHVTLSTPASVIHFSSDIKKNFLVL